MKLTDEQVEFLQKFMGWIFFDNTLFNREAVMDRAVEKGWIRIDFEKCPDIYKCTIAHKACIAVQIFWDKYTGTGPTRFIALVNALMEAEGK